jgi:hypothetical protein
MQTIKVHLIFKFMLVMSVHAVQLPNKTTKLHLDDCIILCWRILFDCLKI